MVERIVIYTAIAGSYDNMIQPYEPQEGFDFICFVPKGTRHEERIGYWRIEELPVSWEDNTLNARFPKLNPQTVLDNYEWSLWIDGNIAIRDASIYRLCRDLQERGVRYAGVPHPFRDCTYDEAETILKNGRESFKNVLHAVRFLNQHGLKRHAGLQETNILFRKHNDAAVMEFDRWWWECLVLHAAGHRDQLMHTFCLRDTASLDWTPLLPGGMTSRDFPGLEYIRHKGLNDVADKPFLCRKMIYALRWPGRLLLKLYLTLFV